MWRVTIRAANIVAPVLAAPKVVVLFLSRMAGKTSFGNLFGRLVLERDDLGRIALRNVGLAGAMTLLAAGNFSFPTADRGKLGMRRMRERLELILMAVFTGLASGIFAGTVACGFSLTEFDGLRRTTRSEPHESSSQRTANEQRLND